MIKQAQCSATVALFMTGLLAVSGVGFVQPARADKEVAGCIPIKTAAQLQAMKNNLAGVYCLMNDIDVGSIANFEPIGALVPFSGRFYGNGHVIRNLKIQSNTVDNDVGLFGRMSVGVIQDVGLISAAVSSASSAYVGAVVGTMQSGRIQRVYSTGKVMCAANVQDCLNGGLVGLVQNGGEILDSWSSAAVVGGYGAGGLFAASAGNTRVTNSYATGDVTCQGSECVAAGGFTAQVSTDDMIVDSYATGKVSCSTASCKVGGFAGFFLGGLVANVYATGAVVGGTGAAAGGLAGVLGGALNASFAAGPVSGGAGSALGGLIGAVTGSPAVTDSYWDTSTTGQMTSAGGFGAGKTTTQLRAALQTGLAPGTWGLTKTLSYPFVVSDGFSSNLATLVLASKIYTALPIQQSDESQYIGNPAHTNQASLATVYTMVARAIGQTQNVALLDNVKINKYFWNDATQTTTFSGPVTSHATLGPMTAIPAAAKLNGTNIIGKFNSQDWVVLRGTYKKPGGGTATHHMLGTLYTKKGTGVVLVIANDPFTGQQVAISPATKKVVLPADFPLTGFTVNGYATISNIH